MFSKLRFFGVSKGKTSQTLTKRDEQVLSVMLNCFARASASANVRSGALSREARGARALVKSSIAASIFSRYLCVRWRIYSNRTPLGLLVSCEIVEMRA